MIAGEDILQGVVQGMADMQNTRHIGRRNNDGEPGFAIFHRGLEAVLLCPGFQPLFFDIAEIVALGQFFRIRFIHHVVLIVFRLPGKDDVSSQPLILNIVDHDPALS
jgi:hypothetical protein